MTALAQTNLSLITTLEAKLNHLVDEMKSNFKALFDQQFEQNKKILQIEATLHSIGINLSDPHLAPFTPSSSSPVPESTPIPTTTPKTTAPPVSMPPSVPPSPTPILPTTSADPTLDPHLVSSSTSSSTTTPPPPQLAPPSNLTFPSFLPDDKGGEN